MKSNVINLLHRGADALQECGDGGTAYALHAAANNLLLVMSGEATLAEWLKCYVFESAQPIDINAHMDARS